MTDPLRLGVLISGGGRTLQNFIDLSHRGELPARVAVVISSHPEAYGLTRAQEAGIPAEVVDRRDYDDSAGFSRTLTTKLKKHEVDLVTLAGFLSFYNIPEEFEGRVMNIHPALLPSFGGRGYYGERVHQAVLDYGCKVSGVTVHFATNRYDEGPIIVQKCVPVHEDDDAHSLADRVFEKELEAYPEAIRLYAAGRLRIEGRRVHIAPPEVERG
jgi:formyltetrahydrofolate-dependent phosphoribosylglycinamide formyltransferase